MSTYLRISDKISIEVKSFSAVTSVDSFLALSRRENPGGVQFQLDEHYLVWAEHNYAGGRYFFPDKFHNREGPISYVFFWPRLGADNDESSKAS